ncbi:MAG: hypothetical protein Q7T30_01120 [Planctomycetota bacterium]|nr:hypothetical protein [Planctomycetota bacterium]
MNATTIPLEPAPGQRRALEPLAVARANFDQLRGRAHFGIWIETLGLVGLLLAAYAIPSFLTDRGLRLEWVFRCALLVTFLVAIGRLVVRRLVRPLTVRLTDDEMALAVERQSPEIKQALISSLQFDRTLQAPPSGVESRAMMAAVVGDVNARLAAIPFARAIDAGRVRRHAAALAFAVAFFGIWGAIDAQSLGIWARRNLVLSNVDWPRHTVLSFAEAGSGGVRMPQGDALTVRVTSNSPAPDQVFLSYDFKGGEKGTEPMSRTGDGEFTLTIDAVLEDVVLRAEGGDALPVELRVTIVERPRIDDLAIKVTFPSYMERDPELVPPTEGEVRLPRGSTLRISGKSHKPVDDAFALFGSEKKIALARAADGFGFAGEFSPEASGLLVIDVIDRDKLGAGAPPKLLLRVGDDKPPTIDFRLRGIGSMIATHARIPGDLKVKDDFGLREIDASMRVTIDTPLDTRPGGSAETPKPPETPFENVVANYTNPMPKSALRYESPAAVDLMQWNPEPDENSTKNRIRPGSLVSMRFGAKDNFGPGDPHHGYGETMTFRVVTREKLLEELRRRQVEQRQELQRIIQEEQTAQLELREMVSPAQAGDREKRVRASLKSLARRQQAIGRRVAFVGESYQRILWEYENNRMIEQNKVRQMESLIPVPLAGVAKDAFPATSRLVEAFSETSVEATRAEAVAGYDDIKRRLEAIMKEMEQAENLAALLEELRVVIKIEDSAIQEVESRVRAAEQKAFGDGKDKQKDDPKKVPEKK